MTEGTDSARILAEHAAATTFDDLPAPVVDRTAMCIADTLAVMLAGSGTDETRALGRIVERWGGAPESTIIGHGLRVPAYAAVLVNGAAVHQHDFDDTHDTAVCHPTSATLVPALAVAESIGGVSGRELITAVALGTDLVARLGLALHGTLWDYPWVRQPVVGIFGAALAAGKVLGLDARGLHNALGLALPQAAGTLECLEGTVSSVRGIRDGLIFKDGVLAALMAAEGLAGDQGVFDGRFGLYHAYFRGDYDRDRLTRGLGESYEGLNVSLKPWPSCRHTHATLTALFELLEQPGVDPAEIDEVVVHVGDGNRRLCDPPRGEYRGRMTLLCNLPWVVAVAIAHRSVPLEAFTEAGFSDPATHAMMERIRFEHDPEQNRHGTIEPGHVRLRLRDGTELTAKADRALGHPERPMSHEQIAEKVRAGARAAYAPLSDEAVVRLSDAALGCASLADVSALADLTIGSTPDQPRRK